MLNFATKKSSPGARSLPAGGDGGIHHLVLLSPLHQSQHRHHVPVHQLVHLKVLVVVTERIVEGLGHLQPTIVEQELQAAQGRDG